MGATKKKSLAILANFFNFISIIHPPLLSIDRMMG
jgi:hypothetical protein